MDGHLDLVAPTYVLTSKMNQALKQAKCAI